MKVAGWLLIALGIVLVPIAFVLNATFASTRFIDDVLWIDTSWTATGSIVPLVVAAMSAVAIATGIVLVLRGRSARPATATVTAETRQIPPGWYPHGNIQRYWDGTAWTDDTAPLA